MHFDLFVQKLSDNWAIKFTEHACSLLKIHLENLYQSSNDPTQLFCHRQLFSEYANSLKKQSRI